jgi:hypothetical protein
LPDPQIDVHQDQIDRRIRSRRYGLLAVIRDNHAVPVLLKDDPLIHRNDRLIFDEEYRS